MAKKKGLTDEEISKYGTDQFQRSSTFRSEVTVQRWKDSNDLYDSKFAKNKGEKDKSDVLASQSRLFIPKTYSHTQRILVDILETIFFDPEEVVDIGSWKSVSSQDRQVVKTLLNYRLAGNPVNFYQEAYEASLDALRNKVGILKVYPKIVSDKFNIDGEDKEVVKEFYPIIECLPYEDVFFDSAATWKDYYKYPIIHRMLKSRDYLKRRKYKNLDLIAAMQNVETNDEIKEQRALSQGSPFASDGMNIVSNLEKIYIYEIWGFMDVNDDGLLESCCFVMAGDGGGPKTLISDIVENTLPYLVPGEDYNRPPIIVGSAFPESHKMYGKDLPEIVEGLQRETNAQRNQRREAVALALRKPLLANRSAGLDLMSLVNRKIGTVVLGDDISDSAVREMQISDPTVTTIQEQAKTDQDFYETTSIPPNLMGMPTSQDETATAVTSHVANANKKIGMIIKNLVETLFVPAFKRLLRLEQEYETDEFIAQLTNAKLGWQFFSDGSPPSDTIQGEFELKANIGLNKQFQLNKLLLVMDRANQVNATIMALVQNGVVQPQSVKFINPLSIFNRMLPLLGEKSPEEFEIQATAPPPEPGTEGIGVASQTGIGANPDDMVSNMNAEGVMSGPVQ